MLQLNCPAPGRPAGWMCLGTMAPGLGFSSTWLPLWVQSCPGWTQMCGTEVPVPCSGSAEPQWVDAELQLLWDP